MIERGITMAKKLKNKNVEHSNVQMSENTRKQMEKAAEKRADKAGDVFTIATGGPVGIVKGGANLVKDSHQARKLEKNAKASLKKDSKYLSKEEQVQLKAEYSEAKSDASREALKHKPKKDIQNTLGKVKDTSKVLTGQTTFKELRKDRKELEKVEDEKLKNEQAEMIESHQLENSGLSKETTEATEVQTEIQTETNKVSYDKMVQDANRLQSNLEIQQGPDYQAGMDY
jgi:hypothetical protein